MTAVFISFNFFSLKRNIAKIKVSENTAADTSKIFYLQYVTDNTEEKFFIR